MPSTTVDVVGRYYLIKLFLPVMISATFNMPGRKAPVINTVTSSMAMLLAPSGGVNYDTHIDHDKSSTVLSSYANKPRLCIG